MTPAMFRCFGTLVLATLLAGGCDEIELNVGDSSPQRPVRPAPEPIRTGRASRAVAPASAPAASRPSTSIEETYFQLVLTSDAVAAQSPPGIQFIHVNHASPRSLGEALAMLYPPSGPSGSSRRYTLIYPLRAEGSTAAAHVGDLDVEASPGSSVASFSCALAAWYALNGEQPAEPSRVRAVVDQLQRAADRAEARKWESWAAIMLAANIRTERMSDFEGAARLFAQAADFAVPGSLEHLASLHGQARALLQAGQRVQARRILETIIGQFGGLRGSEPFERARRILANMDRRR